MVPTSKLPASPFGFATTPIGLCLTRFGCSYFSYCTHLRSAVWRISEATLKLRRCQPSPTVQRTTEAGSRTSVCLKSRCSGSAYSANRQSLLRYVQLDVPRKTRCRAELDSIQVVVGSTPRTIRPGFAGTSPKHHTLRSAAIAGDRYP